MIDPPRFACARRQSGTRLGMQKDIGASYFPRLWATPGWGSPPSRNQSKRAQGAPNPRRSNGMGHAYGGIYTPPVGRPANASSPYP